MKSRNLTSSKSQSLMCFTGKPEVSCPSFPRLNFSSSSDGLDNVKNPPNTSVSPSESFSTTERRIYFNFFIQIYLQSLIIHRPDEMGVRVDTAPGSKVNQMTQEISDGIFKSSLTQLKNFTVLIIEKELNYIFWIFCFRMGFLICHKTYF